jgi:hypothetical protein
MKKSETLVGRPAFRFVKATTVGSVHRRETILIQ